jgi:predicted ATP-grasp superfamily ATP-dependent carboligase
MLERSLGLSSSFAICRRKSKLVNFAGALGIPTPRTVVLKGPEDIAHDLREIGLPAVLKSDALWGGRGVRLVRTEPEARFAFDQMRARPTWADVAKDVIRELRLQPIAEKWSIGQPTVSLQEFVRGRPVNHAAVCWAGEVLAGLTVEVIESRPNNGPGSVVRRIHSPPVEEAVARLSKALGLSGYYGFDFMLNSKLDRLLLIELNPRITSSSYVPLSSGATLSGILHRHLAQREMLDDAVSTRQPTTSGDIVVLFPQELERDCESPYLKLPSHLVPWDEPELAAECIKLAFAKTWSVKLLELLRPHGRHQVLPAVSLVGLLRRLFES